MCKYARGYVCSVDVHIQKKSDSVKLSKDNFFIYLFLSKAFNPVRSSERLLQRR